MNKITFSRSESWEDYRGIHSTTLIFQNGRKVGEISGDSGCGIPVMQYHVQCEGLEAFSSFRLNDAKKKIRETLAL
jgi:hypothetical protein